MTPANRRRWRWMLGAAAVLLLGGVAGLALLLNQQITYWQRYAHAPLPEGPPPAAQYLARVQDGIPLPSDDPALTPSRALSVTGRIPQEHLAQTGSCGNAGCHPDVTAQWSRSIHAFASLNNPLYSRSLEYTRLRKGDAAARWCGGCHDPVLLFSGTLEAALVKPNSPGASAGVSCLTCHSMVGLRDLSGNGGYVLEVPDLSVLDGKGPLGILARALLTVRPEAHRTGLTRDLISTPEMCSSCHRISLTPDINQFHWFRGPDQFGDWRSSGPSGRVARSFYSPASPMRCQDCHMPKVVSSDAGNDDGTVRSHAFPGANTAVPTLQGLPEQIAEVRAMLQGALRIDLFAIRVLDPGIEPASTAEPDLETEPGAETDLLPREPLLAPLETLASRGGSLRSGDRVSLDLVVRNLRVGHGFPAGVLDNKDVWLEIWAEDARGRELWRQGGLDAQQELLPSTHRYGIVLLDEAAQRIDKRNGFDARTALLSRILMPGQSEVVQVHFQVPDLPPGDALVLNARLRYRKATPQYVAWAFAGRRRAESPLPPVGSSVDTGVYALDPTVELPVLPIEEVASARVSLPVSAWSDREKRGRNSDLHPLPGQLAHRTLVETTPSRPARAVTSSRVDAAQIERWQDYGIGFLRVGDAPRAARVFDRIRAELPEALEGFVGQARAALLTRDAERATQVLREAQALVAVQRVPPPASAVARVEALLAQSLLLRGDYAQAQAALERLLQDFPQDASLWLDLAYAAFQQEDLARAQEALDKVLRLEPDHVSAWQLRARVLNQQGRLTDATQASRIFEALSEDLEAQGLRQRYLEKHPELALEARPAHAHVVGHPVEPQHESN